MSGVPFKLEWEPFLLNPNLPDEGEPILEHLKKKYGSSATQRFGDPNSQLMQAGRNVGIEFTNDRNAYPTIKAHSVIEYLKESDNEKANSAMEELFRRYFVQGENINSETVLTEVTSKYGVEKETALTVLKDPVRKKKVLEKDQYYKSGVGVSGVPFYIIEQNSGGRPVGFSGAQPADVIGELLEKASDE
jgi:predicted DsbA family dithiol-disulfide isomerase